MRDDSIERATFQSVLGKVKYIIWVTTFKILRLPTQLINFLDFFWAEMLRIARPVNYSLG